MAVPTTLLREPADELTRRGLLTGGLSLAALMAGGGGAIAGTAEAGFPRTVETGHGPVRELTWACGLRAAGISSGGASAL